MASQATQGPLLPSRLVLQPNTAKYAAIQELLAKQWQLTTHRASYNPSPNPVSLERSHYPLLLKDAYYVSHKTDGVRYLLVLGRFQNHAMRGRQQPEYAVMIDRAMRMFEVRVWADSVYYDGSIYDGELVWEYETDAYLPRQVFYVFDCVAFKGRSYYHEPYYHRLQLVAKAFPYGPDAESNAGYVYCTGNKDAMCFMAKPVLPLYRFQELLQLPLFHATDGLIFTADQQPVGTGRVQSLLKWKSHHTIDIKLKYINGETRVLLYTDQGQEFRADDVASCNIRHHGRQVVFELQPNPELEQFLSSALAQAREEHSDLETIAECELSFHPKVRSIVLLSVTRLRADKHDPNDKLTIERTLVNVQEGITLEELQRTLRPDDTVPSQK